MTGGARAPNHDEPFDPAKGSTTAIHLPNSTVGLAEYARLLALCLLVAVTASQAEFIYLNLAFNGAEAARIKLSPRRREEEATIRDLYKSNIRSKIPKTARFTALLPRVDPSDKLLLQYALASALLPHKLPSRALSALEHNASVLELFMSSPCATDDQILERMEALRGTSHGPTPLSSSLKACAEPSSYDPDSFAAAEIHASMIPERLEHEADCRQLELNYNALAPLTAYDMNIYPPFFDDGSPEPDWTSPAAAFSVTEHLWELYPQSSETPSLTSHQVATLAHMLATDRKGRRA
jgi:hypothetical protein